MQPEDEWITAVRAARILQMTGRNFHWLAAQKGLAVQRGKRCHYFRLDEVENLLHDPDRLRIAANRERKQANRRIASEENAPNDLIDGKTAAHILGVLKSQFRCMVNRGLLTLYPRANGRIKQWFSASEVSALQAARTQRKAERQERARLYPPRRRTYRLPTTGRVEVGDLSSHERYFGDLLTTRQVAWMLHISLSAVWALRESGRLRGMREKVWWGDAVQWHYWKKDVVALMNDPKYMARHVLYERYLSPEGKAARAAEIMQKQWEQIARINRERRLRNALDDWLNEKW